MKYLKLFEDLQDNFDKFLDETLENTIDDIIHDKRLPSYMENISDEDMLSYYGTSDKYLYVFISHIKSSKRLREEYLWRYYNIFWNKLVSFTQKKLMNINDPFLRSLMNMYNTHKQSEKTRLAEELLNGSEIYETKKFILDKKIKKEIVEYLLKKIEEEPNLYLKNKEHFDTYIGDKIPMYLKRGGNANLWSMEGGSE